VIAAPTGIAVAAEKDTDEPALSATADDLSETTRNISSEVGALAAHSPCASHCEFNCLGEEMGEGQSPDLSGKKTLSARSARPESASASGEARAT
jgi:hypothetical protein